MPLPLKVHALNRAGSSAGTCAFFLTAPERHRRSGRKSSEFHGISQTIRSAAGSRARAWCRTEIPLAALPPGNIGDQRPATCGRKRVAEHDRLAPIELLQHRSEVRMPLPAIAVAGHYAEARCFSSSSTYSISRRLPFMSGVGRKPIARNAADSPEPSSR